MLIKTFDTAVADLVEKAQEMMAANPATDKPDHFVPYVDIITNEIRYLHFVFKNNCWVFKNSEIIN